MDLGLSGSVAVVTGASRGIGLAVVRGLAANDPSCDNLVRT
jgi:NAD(P)-dependent dehydrogenase (short-subunit alcohol dehydrogenase family)